MAQDVQTITGDPRNPRTAARLCNFKTGQADLLDAHKLWIVRHVAPAIQALDNPWVDLYGYASRLGNAAANKVLAQRRCDAVRSCIAKLGSHINFPTDIGLGAVGPDANDNDGYYRAAEVYVFGHKPAALPGTTRIPSLPTLTRKVGSTEWKARFVSGISAGSYGAQAECIYFEIVDVASNIAGSFLYGGAGATVPLIDVSGSLPGPYMSFKTTNPVVLSSFDGQAGVSCPPGISVGPLSANSTLSLHLQSDNLSRIGAKAVPNPLVLSTGAGLGLNLGTVTAGRLTLVP